MEGVSGARQKGNRPTNKLLVIKITETCEKRGKRKTDAIEKKAGTHGTGSPPSKGK